MGIGMLEFIKTMYGNIYLAEQQMVWNNQHQTKMNFSSLTTTPSPIDMYRSLRIWVILMLPLSSQESFTEYLMARDFHAQSLHINRCRPNNNQRNAQCLLFKSSQKKRMAHGYNEVFRTEFIGLCN